MSPINRYKESPYSIELGTLYKRYIESINDALY
jgi:hypothetical protein